MQNSSGKVTSLATLAFSYSPGVLNGLSENTRVSRETQPAWKTSDIYVRFSESLARDTQSHALSPEGKALIDAMLSPSASNGPKVKVFSFGVGGVRSNDMFVLIRNPPVEGKTNIVWNMPEYNYTSFHEFKNTQQMSAFLKDLPNRPHDFKLFLSHFGSGPRSEPVVSVKRTMNEWASAPENSKPPTGAGAMGTLFGNVFEHLDRLSQQPVSLVPVNGLAGIHRKAVSPQGGAIYSGVRPDGENVNYQYAANGNLLGVGDKGNYYFLEHGWGSKKPLSSLTPAQFNAVVDKDMLDRLNKAGVVWTTDAILNAIGDALEHPFFWASDFLEAFGVNKEDAGFVENVLDNPVTALLLFLNKHNDIGRPFGMEKKEMDALLSLYGDAAQSVVPHYGAVRAVAAVIGKAIRGEPLTDKEIRETADALHART